VALATASSWVSWERSLRFTRFKPQEQRHFVAQRALASLGRSNITDDGDPAIAAALQDVDAQDAVRESLRWAATNRSQVMWPWEHEPHSIASGILDDETYDWFSLLGATICTGGWPLVVTEEELMLANEISGSAADETGTSGLAGAVAMRNRGDLRADDIVLALFTGIRRVG
jgi:hypothetical protein